MQIGVNRRNTVNGTTKIKIKRKKQSNLNEQTIMPYGNKTKDKILTGQRRLTDWKSEGNKGPKKCKEVEDKSPEIPGSYKKKKRSPKPGKQSKSVKSESKTTNIMEQEKTSQPQSNKEEEGSIDDEVKKLNPDLQRLFKLIDRTITPLRSDVTKLLVGNERVSEHQRKIVMLEEENVILKKKLKKVERNQEKTRTKVDHIESKLLEGNINYEWIRRRGRGGV